MSVSPDRREDKAGPQEACLGWLRGGIGLEQPLLNSRLSVTCSLDGPSLLVPSNTQAPSLGQLLPSAFPGVCGWMHALSSISL